MRRAERLAQQAAKQQPLLGGRAAAGERPDALPRAGEARRGLLERALPRDGAQLAAVAQQRRGDAVLAAEGRVREAPAVAQPAVVDVGVLA